MKRLFICLVFIVVSNAIMARNTEENDSIRKDDQRVYLIAPFWHNWSVCVAGAINLYCGEDDFKGGFSKRLAPAFDVSVIKWITPVVGFRLIGSGGQGRGWYAERKETPGPSKFTKEKIGDLYHEQFSLMTASWDVLVNINNAIGGYRDDRRWNSMLYAGAGMARSAGGVEVNREFTLSLGFLNHIRLAPRLDLSLDLNLMAVNSRLDEVTTLRGFYEGLGTVSVGLSYKLGKFGYKRAQVSNRYDRSLYVKRSDSLEYRTKKIIEKNDSLQAENRRLAATGSDTARREPVVIRDTVVICDTECTVGPLILFFPINNAVLDSKELTSLDFYIRHALEVNPDKVFSLVGAADIATGNSMINQRLSEQRVEAVYRVLIDKYKIPRNQLEKRPEGDRNNQFAEPRLNRAVIIR